MVQNNARDKEPTQIIYADVTSVYGHAWRQMWKYILELLLIVIVGFLFSIPAAGLSVVEEAEGAGAFFVGIFSLAYLVLVLWPIEYGVAYTALKAARGERPEVKDIFEVFQNYGNAILANILTAIIIGFGIILLIIPGIFFACKLAFVPYLIVDKKMEAVEAVKESWRKTEGHALTVFLIGFLAIFIVIAGLIVMVVGVIAAAIWIEVAFASLYYVVSKQAAEQVQAAGA